MKSLVELAYDKHKDWINIVKSFGANKNYAEDIVQEMYIQLICDIQKGLDLWYNDDINTYYCYKVLRGIYLNTHKKQARMLKTYIEDIEGEIKQIDDLGIDEIQYAKNKKAIDKILALDPEGLYSTVRQEAITMCGVIPVTTMLYAARLLGADKSTLIKYMTSGEVSGDFDYVVGYAGMIIR